MPGLKRHEIGSTLRAPVAMAVAIIAALATTLLVPAGATAQAQPATGCSVGNTWTETTVSQQDCDALFALYEALKMDEWTDADRWTIGTDPCTWPDLLCDDGGLSHLIIHDIGRHILSPGSLPVEIGDFSDNLDMLWIGSTSLDGPLIPELGQLTSLTMLGFRDVGLGGSVPPEIFDLPDLRVLDLGGAPIEGGIPAAIGNLPSIEAISISRTNLGREIPSEIGNLKTLRLLDLSDNELIGEIPAALAGANRLATLDLDTNELTGPIPDIFADLDELEHLSLRQNDLYGEIPSSLGQLPRLDTLELEDAGCLWTNDQATLELITRTGQLESLGQNCAPDFGCVFGDVTVKTVVSQPDCDAMFAMYDSLKMAEWSDKAWFYGGDPCSWQGIVCDENGLREIHIPDDGDDFAHLNDVSHLGALPPEIGSFSANLTVLDINESAVGGEIPPEIGNLTSLTKLVIADVDVSGPIPVELFNLTGLQHLDLSLTDLSGGIPSQIGQLTNLETLNLEHTSLGGEIPATIGDLANLRRLFLRHAQLEGQIPAELGQLNLLEHAGLGGNRFHGEIPAALGQLPNLTTLHVGDNDGCIWTADADVRAIIHALDINEIPTGPEGCADPDPGCLQNGAFVETGVSQQDCDALLAIYDAMLIGDLDTPHQTHWVPGTDPCTWLGLSCDETGLTEIAIIDEGEWRDPVRLPAALGDLSPSVRSLVFDETSLHGEIPPELGRLDTLERLKITGTNAVAGLIGGLPPEFYELAALEELEIVAANLTGGLAPEVSQLQSLKTLTIESTPLGGWLPLELGQLTGLLSLRLQATGIEGQIPSELSGLESLHTLGLGGNRLWGPIPPSLEEITNLAYLSLAHNDLTGPIPPQLGNLESLEYLDLSYNHLQGTIPAELAQLDELEILNLSYNSLHGEIPAAFAQMGQLRRLDLQGNGCLWTNDPAVRARLAELGQLANLGIGCGPSGLVLCDAVVTADDVLVLLDAFVGARKAVDKCADDMADGAHVPMELADLTDDGLVDLRDAMLMAQCALDPDLCQVPTQSSGG